MSSLLDRQPLLESDLLLLRPLTENDFDHLYNVASDPLLWEHHPSKNRTEEPVFRAWFQSAIGSGGALAVADKANEVVIGTSRFDHYKPESSEVEIGWTFLARRLWGGGHNGEMKRLMLDHAFNSVETVMFRVHSLNARSQGAVEKLGAVRCGGEPDPQGRGENFIFKLERSDWR